MEKDSRLSPISNIPSSNSDASASLYVIAHNIRSLYNVGSLFRLADGLGVTKLFLTGYTGAPHRRLKYQRQRQQIAKTALESLDAVDWHYQTDPFKIIEQLKQQGVRIVALELTPYSQDLATYHSSGPQCLVLGHETDGVSQQLLDACQSTVHIPMHGQGKSLNVITATSIALYYLASARNKSKSGKQSMVSSE